MGTLSVLAAATIAPDKRQKIASDKRQEIARTLRQSPAPSRVTNL
jgi:hypothetical protein